MLFKKIVCVFVLGILANSAFSQDDQRPGCLDSLYIPKSFSPNGDTKNDSLKIFWKCLPERFEIKIYDNWGTLIFLSTNPNFSWAGTDMNDSGLPSGVYIFIMDYTFQNISTHKSGEIVLMR